ncbi:MAG: DUF1127 domain-containing protein [Aestuariivirgaceae bacterium]
MTTTTIDRSGRGQASWLRSISVWAGRMVRGVVDYAERSHAERQLEALDERLLHDIGVSRTDIHRMVWGKDR